MSSAIATSQSTHDAIELRASANTSEEDQATAGAQHRRTAQAEAVSPLPLTADRRLKLASAAFCFLNAGINDGSLGALIPYILGSYSISTRWMAIPYGVSFFGWFLAALVLGYLRIRLGLGGIIIVGAGLQFLAQLLRFWLPPFGLFSVTFLVVALGQALQDTTANTFVAGLQGAHRWLGLIHGSYAIGGVVGPLVAAAIASNAPVHWPYFYFVPLGIGAINLGLCGWAFRDETVLYQRLKHLSPARQLDQRRSQIALIELRATLKQRPVWMLSIFFFLNLGVAITAGGWVVEYLATVRHGSLDKVGYISSAFYGGLAAGRFLLAEPTFKFGEKRMSLAYFLGCLGLQIVFWRVPNIAVDAVMVSFLGFLLGPAFATGVSIGSKTIPSELQPSGLAMIFVVAQAGGALSPAITGVIAASAGVSAIQPILVGLLAAMVVSWLFVPDPRKKSS